MSDKAHCTGEEARTTGERIGIDWATSSFDVEQFRMGIDVELKHGTQGPETNVISRPRLALKPHETAASR
jgi:hypothetical protein